MTLCEFAVTRDEDNICCRWRSQQQEMQRSSQRQAAEHRPPARYLERKLDLQALLGDFDAIRQATRGMSDQTNRSLV